MNIHDTFFEIEQAIENAEKRSEQAFYDGNDDEYNFQQGRKKGIIDAIYLVSCYSSGDNMDAFEWREFHGKIKFHPYKD